MSQSLLQQLIDAFQCLPGVGAKTAQRMAYHLLQRKREAGKDLAQVLLQAMDEIGQCQSCRNYTEQALCNICLNSKRSENNTLCVVESAADLLAIEQSGQYSGLYFVLHGTLSPLDGVGPSEIGLFELEDKLQNSNINEVILALNPSIEGEATSHFIADICKSSDIAVTRIAHGIPVGGELEMVDTSTISHALQGRKSL